MLHQPSPRLRLASRGLGEGCPPKPGRRRRASPFYHLIAMHYVYLLQSIKHPYQTYVGLTSDLKKRLQKHNYGEVPHTSKYKPWKLISYTAFQNIEQAASFETYLKSGSGRAFAKRRLW